MARGEEQQGSTVFFSLYYIHSDMQLKKKSVLINGYALGVKAHGSFSLTFFFSFDYGMFVTLTMYMLFITKIKHVWNKNIF